jgi:hypothetical protein
LAATTLLSATLIARPWINGIAEALEAASMIANRKTDALVNSAPRTFVCSDLRHPGKRQLRRALTSTAQSGVVLFFSTISTRHSQYDLNRKTILMQSKWFICLRQITIEFGWIRIKGAKVKP